RASRSARILSRSRREDASWPVPPGRFRNSAVRVSTSPVRRRTCAPTSPALFTGGVGRTPTASAAFGGGGLCLARYPFLAARRPLPPALPAQTLPAGAQD